VGFSVATTKILTLPLSSGYILPSPELYTPIQC
jgi:hypothetical protein